MPSFRRLAALVPAAVPALVAVSIAVVPLGAQDAAPALGGCDFTGPRPAFLSPESEIFYGCDALFRASTPQFFSAIGRFQAALARRPNDAIALYLLGVALAGDQRPDSARTVLRRALAIDGNVATTLAPRLAERPALRDVVAAVLENRPVAAVRPPAPAPAPVPVPVPVRVPVPVPGAAAAAVAPPAPVAPVSLVHGDYACTYDYWVGPPAARRRQSDPKGALLVRADGTYRRFANGASGRYRYDAASGTIAWLTGDLATMRPERTTFRRNRRTAQIDITLKGDYAWSCGIDLE